MNDRVLDELSRRLHRVNASFRKSASTGLEQAVPQGQYARGAPAGHAKNYPYGVSRGLDGEWWVSKPNPSGAFRWSRYSGAIPE